MPRNRRVRRRQRAPKLIPRATIRHIVTPRTKTETQEEANSRAVATANRVLRKMISDHEMVEFDTILYSLLHLTVNPYFNKSDMSMYNKVYLMFPAEIPAVSISKRDSILYLAEPFIVYLALVVRAREDKMHISVLTCELTDLSPNQRGRFSINCKLTLLADKNHMKWFQRWLRIALIELIYTEDLLGC